MTIQQFIERAIEGGWTPEGYDFAGKAYSWKVQAVSKIKFKERIFLDPLAWKAVGKVEGWHGGVEGGIQNMHNHWNLPRWQENMHRMIDALAEGKTIEQYLEKL